MLERFEDIVPVDVSADIEAGTLLEYDTTNHYYTPVSSGDPVGVLMEAVSQNQDPAYAKVLFFGVVYVDELASEPDEDTKAKLRKVGIFVKKREEA